MLLPYLLPYSHILAAYDDDDAGHSGAARLTEIVRNIHALTVPVGGDLVGFWQASGNVREWLLYHLRQLSIPIGPDQSQKRSTVVAGTQQSDGQARDSGEAAACDVIQAQSLAELYVVLYPDYEWNGRLDVLDANLRLCQDWARTQGVLQVLMDHIHKALPQITYEAA